MRQFCVYLLLFLFSSSLYSQNGGIATQNFLTQANSVSPSLPVYLTSTSSMVKDDPVMMLSKEFSKAEVYLHDTVMVEVMARYNIKLDRMEYLAGADTIRQIYPQQVQLVVLNEAIFLPLEYFKDYNIRIGWFEVMTAGDITLLKQREAFRRKTDYHPGAMKLDNYEWDSRDAFFYFPDGEDMPTYFYASKSNVLKIMSKYKKEIQAFMKEHKSKIRQGNDLKMLFIRYNQLAAGKM